MIAMRKRRFKVTGRQFAGRQAVPVAMVARTSRMRGWPGGYGSHDYAAPGWSIRVWQNTVMRERIRRDMIADLMEG